MCARARAVVCAQALTELLTEVVCAQALTELLTELVSIRSVSNQSEFIAKHELGEAKLQLQNAFALSASATDNRLTKHTESIKRENERLRNELEKLKSEIKNDFDRFQSGHRLDMNLERGRVRDEIRMHDERLESTDQKLRDEVSVLRTNIEKVKLDMVRIFAGALVSTLGIVLGALRFIKTGSPV
jgi:hypothetical protein